MIKLKKNSDLYFCFWCWKFYYKLQYYLPFEKLNFVCLDLWNSFVQEAQDGHPERERFQEATLARNFIFRSYKKKSRNPSSPLEVTEERMIWEMEPKFEISDLDETHQQARTLGIGVISIEILHSIVLQERKIWCFVWSWRQH